MDDGVGGGTGGPVLDRRSGRVDRAAASPAAAQDDTADAELHALRARAYAPGADIAADPAAAARLAELEAARRARIARHRAEAARAAESVTAASVGAASVTAVARRRDELSPAQRAVVEGIPEELLPAFASVHDDEAPIGTDPDGSSADTSDAPEAVDAAARDGDGDGDGPRSASGSASVSASGSASVSHRRRTGRTTGRTGPSLLRRRPVIAWAASLAAVAVVAAGVTFFATARSASTATALPQDARVTHVTTLLPTGAELPPLFENWIGSENADDPLAFEQFFGLALFDLGDAWSNGRGFEVDSLRGQERCLVMTDASMLEPNPNGSGARTGSFNQGCSAGAFPAAITMIVREEQPDELRERYPIGTALQFVLTDAGVDVFVSPALEPAETPTARAAQPAG